MLGATHFGGGIRAESFGVDGFVRGSSFDPQSFVSLGLAFRAGPAHVGPPEVAGSIRVAATLPFGLIGHDSLRIPVDVGLVFGRRIRIAPALPGKFFL